ncbi:hypothetical protein N9U23_03180 [Candidatus Pelagibacter sp.]|nr:hypothetical protein [Candidatus Pelagibacter sp.]
MNSLHGFQVMLTNLFKKIKIILIQFIFIFLIFNQQSLTEADEINDFELDGISVGDSLLEHMSEDDIKKNIVDVYNYIDDKKFIVSGFFTNNLSSKYRLIQVTFKKNDNKYILYGVEGIINPMIFSECLITQQEVEKNIKNLFKNYEKFGPDIIKHPVDQTGKSIVNQIAFELDGNVVLIECYDFSVQASYPDSFKISVYSKELNEWLQKYQ